MSDADVHNNTASYAANMVYHLQTAFDFINISPTYKYMFCDDSNSRVVCSKANKLAKKRTFSFLSYL